MQGAAGIGEKNVEQITGSNLAEQFRAEPSYTTRARVQHSIRVRYARDGLPDIILQVMQAISRRRELR